MTINLLLAFWFHLAGDILYQRNLLAKRGFFIFCIPISFLGWKLNAEGVTEIIPK